MHALVKRIGTGFDPLHRLRAPGIELVGDGRQLEQRLLECVEAVLVAWCHVDPSVSWRVTCAWHAVCASARRPVAVAAPPRSEEHTSELQSLMRTSYAVFCLKKKNTGIYTPKGPR